MMSRGLEAVTGVDVEESRTGEAQRRNLHNAHYPMFDGLTPPFTGGTFDGTLMIEVFEHVADESRVLSEIFRVLKPGGILILISPNRWFPIEGHFITIGSKTIGPAPLIPWLPEKTDTQRERGSKLLAERAGPSCARRRLCNQRNRVHLAGIGEISMAAAKSYRLVPAKLPHMGPRSGITETWSVNHGSGGKACNCALMLIANGSHH
jgi:SAM-dependent methyltransferase